MKSAASRDILSVSEINSQISNQLESEFHSIWIQGEISNFTNHSSGHWYLTLKDKKSSISTVMFRGQNKTCKFIPENGQEVIVQGQISVYSPRGSYQILCSYMELAGRGDLQKSFEELKIKLEKEGLFDPKLKKPIPSAPKHLACITSPTGAAFKDILKVLNRRFRALPVTLIPAVVQGEKSAASLITALGYAQLLPDVDVIIIGRGGGSLEDLWSFNDERLARAIHHSPIPIISAVGHEIDFTIADFVADLRAPTPSAAAELVVKNAQDILSQTKKIKQQLLSSFNFHLGFWKEKLKNLEVRIPNPEREIQEHWQRLDELTSSLVNSVRQQMDKQATQLKNYKQLLESLNPKQVLERGFCIAKTTKGKVIINSKDIKLKDNLSLEFFKGQAQVTVTDKG